MVVVLHRGNQAGEFGPFFCSPRHTTRRLLAGWLETHFGYKNTCWQLCKLHCAEQEIIVHYYTAFGVLGGGRGGGGCLVIWLLLLLPLLYLFIA